MHVVFRQIIIIKVYKYIIMLAFPAGHDNNDNMTAGHLTLSLSLSLLCLCLSLCLSVSPSPPLSLPPSLPPFLTLLRITLTLSLSFPLTSTQDGKTDRQTRTSNIFNVVTEMFTISNQTIKPQNYYISDHYHYTHSYNTETILHARQY